MALHPNFPESPHEIIDMTQGAPPIQPVRDVRYPLRSTGANSWILGGRGAPPTEKATNFQYMGAWVNIATNLLAQ